MSIKIGKNCKIGNLKLNPNYKEIIIGDNVTIGDGVRINAEYLKIGDRSVIGEGFVIEGTHIELGIEFFSDRNCTIGGGSCHEMRSFLKIGDLCYMGDHVFINTARPVTIGDEVGLGAYTRISTHGVYLSMLEGFPVTFAPVKIGNKVWIPNAQIFPNVTIGNNAVIGAGSVVRENVPEGCLAVGVPAKIVNGVHYPKPSLSPNEFKDMFEEFMKHFTYDIIGKRVEYQIEDRRAYIDKCLTLFDFDDFRIDGRATEITDKFKNELRRYGVRFKYYNDNGVYKSW